MFYILDSIEKCELSSNQPLFSDFVGTRLFHLGEIATDGLGHDTCCGSITLVLAEKKSERTSITISFRPSYF